MCQYCGGTGLCYFLYSVFGLKIYSKIQKLLQSKNLKKGISRVLGQKENTGCKFMVREKVKYFFVKGGWF